jgi:hypothetical protein
MYEAAASCKDIARAFVTNLEPRDVTTPWGTGWKFSSFATLRGNVTSVDPSLGERVAMLLLYVITCHVIAERLLSPEALAQSA